ncbi:TonB-dependent receptor [Corynebacterium tapiri]|uniref:Uncharacterized protein n=1 Tax=Corynebacterium tapiri TaxID=1448266 RepID=A0A5C4U3N0_9CORY|nr:TonB-dependent receptor [Corynebacterium tapiri]TNL96792.1 hypothetical protein FHE74_07160 [Corynebacterium tapiri]
MRRFLTAAAAAAIAVTASPVAQAIPAMPQGYPIAGLYEQCDGSQAPQWRFGEIGRRYLSDGTVQFANTTDQAVDYTATIETGTNHEISANSKASLPSGWNTTAKSDIGLKESNGWLTNETFGPIKLQPGESFRVEYGVLEKDFISMFTKCENGILSNEASADVIRGTGPAERYAFAYIIRADGTVSNLAMEIPSRSAGANSKPSGDTYTEVSGPSLEKIANPTVDTIIPPNASFQRDPSWPKEGEKCRDRRWYPHSIEGVNPTYRKPGYSTDFLNWSEGEYTFTPRTEFVVGGRYDGFSSSYVVKPHHAPDGWLESVGAIYRAYMPVNTELKPVVLAKGERVRVEYGTTMTRINYTEMTCGKDGTYSLKHTFDQASAPVGFWAEATITSPDGSVRKQDVTPDQWAQLPVPTQSAN